MISVRILPELLIDDHETTPYTRARIVEYAVWTGDAPHRRAVELSGDLAEMLAGPVPTGPVVAGAGPTMPLGDIIAAARDAGTLDAGETDIADILEAIA